MTRTTTHHLPLCTGSTYPRHFVEVRLPDGQWHDVGNYASLSDAAAVAAAVEIVGNSWRLPVELPARIRA